jgi:translation initiation factor eIF-2B subunit alpha
MLISPYTHSEEVVRILERAGVPARVVLDCGVGPAMESADMCIVGAEGVMENGGIVNKVEI